ncbi:carbonic anhydrase [Occultella kanbiaonis]|uniref:carbonic anhydrase n=1 Tax=Occultella kanbiaonis TaxID=2675754 RepID=UPI001E524C59|nr:carbonic anhydrase [Occultella kanbiaonis]
MRDIGQIANENTTATMEFAVAELDLALIVVLAHRSCGAVAAAINQTSASPNRVTAAIKHELEAIQPAVHQDGSASTGTLPMSTRPRSTRMRSGGVISWRRSTRSCAVRASSAMRSPPADSASSAANINSKTAGSRRSPRWAR